MKKINVNDLTLREKIGQCLSASYTPLNLYRKNSANNLKPWELSIKR